MIARTTRGWSGQVDNVAVTMIDVAPGESVEVAPTTGRAVILLIPEEFEGTVTNL